MNTASNTQTKPCICIKLRRTAKKITEFYDKALAPVGINVNQYSLLVNISRIEGCGTGELAKKIRLESSTLVRTLHPLLKGGLIIDKTSGVGRRRRLYLTPSGKDMLAKAFPLWSQAQEDILVKLGKSHDELMDTLTKIDLLD